MRPAFFVSVMIKQIENWLLEPVYAEGIELYNLYGSSELLKRLFRESADNFNKKKLFQELTKILDIAKAQEAEKPVQTETDDIKALRAVAGNLMDQRAAAKERARVIVSLGIHQSDELKSIAYQLAYDLKEELDQTYGRIKYWQVNGYLPQSDKIAISGITELIKRRNTVRTYLSRKGDPEKIKKWRAELFELDQKIKETE